MRPKLEALHGDDESSLRVLLVNLLRRVIISDFAHKVSETLVARVLLIGIGLMTSVVIARILGPEGRGFYSVALTVGAIGMQFGNLGLHASNTYFVARNRGLLAYIVSNTLLISLAFGGGGAFLAWTLFVVWPRLAPIQGDLLLLALASIPVGLAYLLLQNLILGIQEVRAFNTIEIASKLLGVTVIGVVIYFERVTVESVFSSQLIALLFGFGWSLILLRKHFTSWLLPSLALLREHLGYGFRSFLASFCAFLVLKLDLLLVQYILGATQAGYYSIAVSMAEMVYLLPTVAGTILFPKLSAMSNDRDKWEFTKTITLMMSGVMAVICCVGGLLVRPAVLHLFGEAFLPAVPAFLWLMPGILFWSNSTFPLLYLQSTGMPRQVLYIWVFLIVLNVALNLLLLKFWGIAGAAFASSITYVMSFLAFGAYARMRNHG